MEKQLATEILRLRLSQMLINEHYKSGDFKIPVHIALGHETIAVAIDSIMEETDSLICSHRNMHYNLARAKKLRPILLEFLLKDGGLAGSTLGSMNLANEAANIPYTSSILGNNLPVSAGVALSHLVKGDDGVTFVVTGDGAMEEGTFYEVLGIARANDLPLAIIVENNGWSMHTQIDERRSSIDVSGLCAALGVSYEHLSGNDVSKYIEILSKVRKGLKKGEPCVVEVSVSTLGGWYVGEGEDKRFIHPHAGVLPEVSFSSWPILEESVADPVYVLTKQFSEVELKEKAESIATQIQEEVKNI